MECGDNWINGNLKLLRTVAEDLKVPLHRMDTAIQQNKILGDNNTQEIEILLRSAINMVDCYSLSAQLNQTQIPLNLDPISVNLIVYDCALEMQGFAELQGVKIETIFKRNIGLAYGNRLLISSIIKCIAYSMLLNSEPNPEPKVAQTCMIKIQKTGKGIDVGMFSNVDLPVKENLQNLKKNYGKVRQATADFIYGSSASLLLANSLCEKLDTKLIPVKFRKFSGYSFNLLPSKQLSLV